MGSQNNAYRNAMAKRYATTRTGNNTYGYTGQGRTSRAGINRLNANNLDLSGLGGLFGGRGGGSGFAYDDLQRQLEYDKMVWERSTPNIDGVGGSVEWDRENNTVKSTLSDENQAIYDDMVRRQSMFGDLANNLASGGWQDAQKQLFDQQRALYAEGDQIAQDQLLERELAMGRGAESTAGFNERRAMQSGIDQRDMGLLNNAFVQSQGLIDSNLNRQRNDIASMMNLGNVANSMIAMPSPNTAGNIGNVSTASTRYADNLAMESAKRRKGMSDMWGSILGGGSSSGGLFSKVICTAMNDDYGFGVYRNAIWLKYAEINYKDKPEMEKGYHALCLPMLKIRKKWYGKPTYAWLKHVAKHRTADLRAEMYGKKRDRIGQAWRFILEPLCYFVGKRLMKKL